MAYSKQFHPESESGTQPTRRLLDLDANDEKTMKDAEKPEEEPASLATPTIPILFQRNFEAAFGGPMIAAGSSEARALAQRSTQSGSGAGNYYGGLRTDTAVKRPSVQAGGFDPYAASAYLTTNATSTSRGICAFAVRQSCERSGINTADHPLNAQDYGAFLPGWGFQEVGAGNGTAFNNSHEKYIPQVGDIAVFSKNHIAMLCTDGTWRSDFDQKDMWGGPKFREGDTSFQVFRHKTLMDGNALLADNGRKAEQSLPSTPLAGTGQALQDRKPANNFPVPSPKMGTS